MTSKSIQAIKNKDVEVMLVSKDIAKEIQNLKDKLNTSSLDVICSAIELLKQSINKEIVLREPQSGKESIITALSKLDN